MQIEVSGKENQVRIKTGVTYVSVTECATMLGLSNSTVYQMLRDGRIDGAFRINRSWRIPVLEPRSK